MKNLRKLFEESLEEVKNVGIPYGNIVEVIASSNLKKAWGTCRSNGKGGFIIKISTTLLTDDVSDNSTKETIIHEILHTCKGCMNHGSKWKYYADIINWKYKGKYNITRTTNEEDKGVEFNPRMYKYVIRCEKCGIQAGYNRICETVKATKLGYTQCIKCGGKFKLIKGNV